MWFEIFAILTVTGIVVLAVFVLVSRTKMTQQVVPGIMGYPQPVADQARDLLEPTSPEGMIGDLPPPSSQRMMEDEVAGDVEGSLANLEQAKAKRARSTLGEMPVEEYPEHKEAEKTITPSGSRMVADLRVQYPEVAFVGKADYVLRVILDPRAIPVDWMVPEGQVETKSTLSFTADELTPELTVAVTSTAFEFSQPNKTIVLRTDQACEVMFVFHPLQKQEGQRNINVTISYKGNIVKELMVAVQVKDLVIDGLQFQHVRRLKMVSTLLSAASGIITWLMQVLGL